VYCKSGQRSEFAKQMLLSLGYVNVENIGGYEALKAIDFNIVDRP
jgi:rhodanese-related sulfurtransferase